MHTTFIHYTEEETPLVRRLYAELLAKGVRPWAAIYDTAPGDKPDVAEQRAMQDSQFVLLLLSKKFLRNQAAVALMEEAGAAGKTLIPVLLDTGLTLPPGLPEGIKFKRRYAEAVAEILAQLPQDAAPLEEVPPLQMGHEAYQLEDYEGAIELYLAAGDEDAEALHGLAAAYNAVRQHDKALEAVNAAIALQPDLAKLYRNRSLALSGLSRHEEALADDEKGIQLDGDNPQVWSSYGMTLLAVGRPDEAKSALEKALSLNPDEALYHYQLGVVAIQQGDFEAALATLERSLELDPEQVDPINARRLILGRLGRLDEVLAEVDKEIKKNPRRGGAYVSRSLINFYLERYQEAVKDATASLERGQAAQPAPYYNRAIAHWKLGNVEAAQADLLKAMEIFPDLRTASGIRRNAESEQTADPGLAILESLQESGQI